jgi:glucose-1-phosphate adenylyltransferase
MALVLAAGRSPGLARDQAPGSGERQNLPDLGGRTLQAHFGGKFRSVDFVLSNCINSGIRRVAVLSTNRSHSLQRHLKRSWAFLKGDAAEFIELWQPQARATGDATPEPTVGVLAANRDLLARSGVDFVVLLTGDRIYKMNYASLVADHLAKGRDCTVACFEAPTEAGLAGSWMTVDAQWRITDSALCHGGLARLSAPPTQARLRPLQGMGIYVFNRNYLLAEVDRDLSDPASGHDLENDIVARAVHSGRVSAHPFAQSCVGTSAGRALYWRDVSTVDAYWDANIDLTASLPQLDLYDSNWPMRAQQAELAPAKFLHNEVDRRGVAIESLVSGGSIVSGTVLRSVLFASVRVHSYAQVEWSVLLPEVKVGRHARLRRVVVDRGCNVPDGLVVGEDADADATRFHRTEGGITLITAAALARLAVHADT